MAYEMLIDGKLVTGTSSLDVINPATGDVFASCARADEAQLENAVAAAKKSFPAWSAMGFEGRREKIIALADAMDARFDEFSTLLTQEQGKPLMQAEHEIGGSIAALRAFAEMKISLVTLKENAHERIVRQRVPLGVIAAITPWNFPMLLLMMKVGPALITGNTMIVKPAPTTPLTTLLFGEVAASILPAGVLNVIIDENDLGALLTKHPDVAKISFTGSTATGKRVMQSASSTLKRLTLELGGNDAAIILDDINVKEMVPQIFQAAILNAGQVCLAAKRIYVPDSIYDEVCEELARLANDALVDDGLKSGTQVGPIQNRQQFEKVIGYLNNARAQGKVISGGEPLSRPGYFIPPTVVRDIPDSSELVQEEQFGPILPVLSYKSIDEAIARANDSEYGLGGTIWTSNPARGFDVALRINSGTVWVNKHLDLPFDVAFGGAKQSGIGVELGQEGMEEFTQAKIINMAL